MFEGIKIQAVNRLQNTVRLPVRPLGRVSTFVVRELPKDLQKVKAGEKSPQELSQQIDDRIATVSLERVAKLGRRNRNIAQLDTTILQSAIVSVGGTPGKNLLKTVHQLSASTGMLPSLSYEGIIMINPFQDARTFTEGRIGAVELEFYKVHRRIEKSLERLNRNTKNAIEAVAGGNVNAAMQLLDMTQRHQIRIVRQLSIVAQVMKPEDFARFREYFTGYPQNVKGPSGAFSANVPVLDILLSGTNLPPERYQYMKDNMQYFPRQGQQDIALAQQLVKQYGSLDDVVKNHPQLAKLIEELHAFLFMFRGKHYGGVARQVPGALEGKVSGTGGEQDVKGFLLGRMRFNKDRSRRPQ